MTRAFFGGQMPLFPEIEPKVTPQEDEAFNDLTEKQKDYIKAIGTDTYTGGSVDYYAVEISKPTSGAAPYTAECNDIIEALGMNFAQGNIFKAVWRMCAAENLALSKRGYKDGLYDAEKIVFFGQREIAKRT